MISYEFDIIIYIFIYTLTFHFQDGNEKLAALWMYAAQTASMATPKPKMTPSGRSVMLIPATGSVS